MPFDKQQQLSWNISKNVFWIVAYNTSRSFVPVPPESSPFKHNPLYPAVYASSVHAKDAHKRIDLNVIKPSLDDLLRRRAPSFQFGFLEKLFAKGGIPRSLSRSRRTQLFEDLRSNYDPQFSALEPSVREIIVNYFYSHLDHEYFTYRIKGMSDAARAKADELGPFCLLWYRLLHKKGYTSLGTIPAFVHAAINLLDFETFFCRSVLESIFMLCLTELYRRDQSLPIVPDYLFRATSVADFTTRLDADTALMARLAEAIPERNRRREGLALYGASNPRRPAMERHLAEFEQSIGAHVHWIDNAEVLHKLSGALDQHGGQRRLIEQLASLNNDKEQQCSAN